MPVTGAGVNRNLLFAAGCLMVAISACGSTSTSPAPARTSGTAQAAAGSDQVLATVEGQPITAGEVRKALGQNLSKLEEQAYELKKQQVEELIAEKLLAAEATRRGTTVDALVQQEVTAHIPPVTDSEIAAFVAANRSRIPGDPAKFTGQIRSYLGAQRYRIPAPDVRQRAAGESEGGDASGGAACLPRRRRDRRSPGTW